MGLTSRSILPSPCPGRWLFVFWKVPSHRGRNVNRFPFFSNYYQWCFVDLAFMLFSHSVVSDALLPHGLQRARLPCPSLFLGVCSNACLLNQWWHWMISSSVTPFSCRQSFPASGSFHRSQFFHKVAEVQSFGVSASACVYSFSDSFFLIGYYKMLNIVVPCAVQ